MTAQSKNRHHLTHVFELNILNYTVAKKYFQFKFISSDYTSVDILKDLINCYWSGLLSILEEFLVAISFSGPEIY